jgi:membrane protein
MNLKVLWELTKETATEWDKDKCPRLGAALSYYTLFSMAPIVIIAIAIAGLIFGEEAARGQIVAQLQGLVGVEGGKAIQSLLENARHPSESILATVIGVAMLLVGATGAFVELQDSLNTVWEVVPRPGQGLLRMLKTRLLSFGVVVGVGFLLLVSLVISAGLSLLGTYLGGFLLEGSVFWQIANTVISFAVVTFLFAMIYKILPDVTVAWRDVWVGAIVTAALFTIGKYLIGLYIGNSGVASSYGAAGSLVALMIWIYYSSQILLFGAEFTQVFAARYGRRIVPTSIAISVPDALCTREDVKEIADEVVKSQKKEEAEEKDGADRTDAAEKVEEKEEADRTDAAEKVEEKDGREVRTRPPYSQSKIQNRQSKM